MGESTDEIKQEIALQRNQLGSNLNELETKAKSLTDWRGQFEKNPMTMVRIVFFMLSPSIFFTNIKRYRFY